jgi:hypothetical protein
VAVFAFHANRHGLPPDSNRACESRQFNTARVRSADQMDRPSLTRARKWSKRFVAMRMPSAPDAL